jgi:hypothetical protein
MQSTEISQQTEDTAKVGAAMTGDIGQALSLFSIINRGPYGYVYERATLSGIALSCFSRGGGKLEMHGPSGEDDDDGFLSQKIHQFKTMARILPHTGLRVANVLVILAVVA